MARASWRGAAGIVLGVTDPNGDTVTITITGIFQDEPVGRQKSSSPDAIIPHPNFNSAEIRVERDGNGDGRVYHVVFTASDGRGGSCNNGQVRIGIVPHDQSIDLDFVDGGPLYDSTVRDP